MVKKYTFTKGLNKLGKWSRNAKWNLILTCKDLHDKWSRPVECCKQRVLGVQEHGSLKEASQAAREVKKAFGILAFIGKCIAYHHWEGY